MPKVIYEVFDRKTKSIIEIDPSTPEILISHRQWSELTRDEKIRVKNTLASDLSKPSGAILKHELPA